VNAPVNPEGVAGASNDWTGAVIRFSSHAKMTNEIQICFSKWWENEKRNSNPFFKVMRKRKTKLISVFQSENEIRSSKPFFKVRRKRYLFKVQRKRITKNEIQIRLTLSISFSSSLFLGLVPLCSILWVHVMVFLLLDQLSFLFHMPEGPSWWTHTWISRCILSTEFSKPSH